MANTFRDLAKQMVYGNPPDPSHKPSQGDFVRLNSRIDQELAPLQASASSASVVRNTWTELAAITGSSAGQRAEVLDDPATHTDPVTAGTVFNEGIYAWVVGDGWERLGDREVPDTGLTAAAEDLFSTASPVFSTGDPRQSNGISSTFCGWAQAFTWDTTPFDMVKMWIEVEESGLPVRISVWNSARTQRLATAVVVPLQKVGFVWVRLNRRITTDIIAGPVALYISVHAVDAATRVANFLSSDTYVYPGSATYPQLYVGNDGADVERLAVWTAVGGDGTSRPSTFKLYDSHDLVAKPTREKANRPRSNQPIIIPRIRGRVGSEINIYVADAISASGPKVFDISGSGVGMMQNERWTLTAEAPIAAPMLMKVLDPDEYNILEALEFDIDIRSATCAGGTTRSMLCLGDSTTAEGKYTQKMLDMATENPGNLGLTLRGTKGTGSNKFEGNGGWKTSDWLQPDSAPKLALNPFVQTLGGKFDASYFISSTGQAAWNCTLIHLGINDISGETSDAGAHSQMDAALLNIAKIMGITTDPDVGSILETNGAAKFLIAVTIPPAAHQDAWGYVQKDAHKRYRYRRNQIIAAYRIIEYFKDMEGDGVALLPWNTAVDSTHGFQFSAPQVANADTLTEITRQIDTVHPNKAAIGGFEQMGRVAYDHYSALIAELGW